MLNNILSFFNKLLKKGQGPLSIANDINIKLFETAIGLKSESSILHLSAREDSSSLLPIGLNQELKYPGTHQTGIIPIEVAPLTNFLKLEHQM